MHDDIKKFSLTGSVNEASLVKTRERLIGFVEGQMRDFGYVPSLDLEPHWTVDYDMKSQQFNFVLSVYGVQESKELAWATAGVMNGKRIPRYTPSSN